MKFRQETRPQSLEISIMAGNSRVSRDVETGAITVQAQLAAFRAALSRAVEIKGNSDTLPSISIALDHRGTFRKQFLLDGLTNSQKRHPKLSQLRPEIVAVFQPLTDEFGIPLHAIAVIHEDSARTHASHLIQTSDLPVGLMRLMRVDPDIYDDEEDDGTSMHNASCPAGTRAPDRVTCAAVTSEYFLNSTDKNSSVLEVFFENDIWSQANIYTRGAVVMKELGSTVDVHLRIVDKSGSVLGAKRPIRAAVADKKECGNLAGECSGIVVDNICQTCFKPASRKTDFALHATR